jgi:preprotein translocase subunit SecG
LERVVDSNKNIIYIGLGILAGVVLIFWMLPTWILRPTLYTLLAFGSVFLILLVLIQRGRGGGLAGALGGMGGYSAFGTRAGDVFTRVTIVAASLWILGAMALARLNDKLYDNPGPAIQKSQGQGTDSESPASSTTDPDASGGLSPLGDAPTAEKRSESDSTDR